jgi:hypothetical protein
MFTAISAFGDSIPPLFITSNKTFEQAKLAEEQLYHGHDYVIRMAPKTFMTEVRLTDWLQNLFIQRNAALRAKMDYTAPIILLVDGHATHITPRVVAFASSQQIILIKLVPHSSYISHPLDLWVFGVFKMLCQHEQKTKGMKGDTLTMYRGVLAFYKATIIPMVR